MTDHTYKDRTVSFPDDELEWFTTAVAPVAGWVVVMDDDPDWVEPVAAWLTQELRPVGGSAVYDTRVVAGTPDFTPQKYLRPANDVTSSVIPAPASSRLVHESALDAHLAHLRRRAAQ